MNTNKNIILYIRLLPIVSIILLMTFIMLFTLNVQKNSLEDELEKMSSLYVENQKKIITYQVKHVIDYISYQLKEKSNSIEDIKQDSLKMISNIRFGEKGYIYVIDGSGKLLTHRNKNIINSDAFKIKDTNGFYYMKEGYRIAKNERTGFLEYISVTNTDMYWNKEKKLTYVEYFEEFDWAISAGVYNIDIDKMLKKHLKQIKEKYSYENKQLIFVSTVFALIVMIISISLAKKLQI